MTDFAIPAHLQDALQSLSATGFATSDVWYHGTASGVVPSILEQGLTRIGDQTLREHQLKTLSTIGHTTTDHAEPVFLTQSKELAFYWAEQKTHSRNLYLQGNESPVVLAVALPDELASQVSTDVGGAALVLEPGNAYIQYLKALYAEAEIEFPEINPFEVDRSAYLNVLGLAYVAQDIAPEYLRVVDA